jgi:hypothetical protein
LAAAQKFQVVDGGSGRIALRGVNDNKLCAEDTRIECNRNAIGQWEKYEVVQWKNSMQYVALRGGKDGKFCADEEGGVKCNRNDLGLWEIFMSTG